MRLSQVFFKYAYKKTELQEVFHFTCLWTQTSHIKMYPVLAPLKLKRQLSALASTLSIKISSKI